MSVLVFLLRESIDRATQDITEALRIAKAPNGNQERMVELLEQAKRELDYIVKQ